MPTNNVEEIIIVPLPTADTPPTIDGSENLSFSVSNTQKMTSNETTISGIADNGIAKYTPNGKYVITASSGVDKAYNAFNKDDKHWECNNTENGSYSKNPYTGGIDDSAYVGGGSDNIFSTPITYSPSKRTAPLRGEWIQIHIPYQAYIQSYRIKTPDGTVNTFPRKFLFAGSNDEKTWTQLDQRNLNKNDLTNNLTNEKMFDINTTDKYSYFRLIINGMGPNMSTVKIQEIQLVGTTMITTNPNADTNVDTFITLTRSIEINDKCNNNRSYDGINMYDKQYAKYDNYAIQFVENDQINKNDLDINTQRQREFQNNQNMIYLTQSSIVAGVVLTAAFIYTLIRN